MNSGADLYSVDGIYLRTLPTQRKLLRWFKILY